jgi:hypothetical protein
MKSHLFQKEDGYRDAGGKLQEIYTNFSEQNK